jgi:hypothetical protein
MSLDSVSKTVVEEETEVFHLKKKIEELEKIIASFGIEERKKDTYSLDVLKEQYTIHQNYVKMRMASSKKLGVTIRFPCIPEDISENLVKFILHKKGDVTSRWNTEHGDLYSDIEGKQECKCFTSDGPLSFTPSSEWDVLYFLDAQKWLTNEFVLYKVNIKRSSTEWKNIKVNKTQTFEEQATMGRRPRINWTLLYPQVSHVCEKIFEGSIDSIFE